MLWKQFQVQYRVVGALLIREVLALYGRHGLGAGWVIAEPLTFAIPVLTLWYFVREPFEHGTAMMPLLLCGYMPLLLFRHIGGAMLGFIRQNSGLLYHRNVTLFDIFVARCLLQIVQNITAFVVVYLLFYMVGILQGPRDIALMIIGYLFMVWWCVNVGLIVGALSERATWVEKVWATYSYTYMAYSGMWFMAAWLPDKLRIVALYQPSLQAYEMIRAGVLGQTITSYYDMAYTAFVLAIMTWMGLLALRLGRKYVNID